MAKRKNRRPRYKLRSTTTYKNIETEYIHAQVNNLGVDCMAITKILCSGRDDKAAWTEIGKHQRQWLEKRLRIKKTPAY